MKNEFRILDINQNVSGVRDLACKVCTTAKQNAIHVSKCRGRACPYPEYKWTYLWGGIKNENRSYV
jgi:hypothetical protein